MVNLNKKQLENAPAYKPEEDIDWTTEYSRQVDDFYKWPTDPH